MRLIFNDIMNEVWKDITNYNGYQVSNLGRVRTYNKTTYTKKHGVRHWKNRILKERIDKKNRMLSVNLYKNGKGKSFLIHRLVAQEFLGFPENKSMTVNHKDGDRLNNKLENLEWLSLKDNIKHGFENGLYCNQIAIKVENKKNGQIYIYRSMSEASKNIQQNHGYISRKIKNGIYENKKFKWKPIN